MRVFVIFLVFLSLPHFLKRDFKLPPRLPIPYQAEWEVPPASPEILSILHQTFTYLARGNQATVFESEDGQYVLKLFRTTRSPFRLIEKLKSLIAQWTHKKVKQDRFTKAFKTFNAAHMAYTKAASLTEVLFCHLNLTENELPILTLKAHRTFSLPLDRARFVLQKKVTPFATALLSARNDPEKMQGLIDSFFKLIAQRSALGIRNSDPNLPPNFGFLEGKAVEIDFGNYRQGADPQEIKNLRKRFKDWLAKNAPEYLPKIQD